MQQPSQMKQCPQCGGWHPLMVPQCACGHVFRTQFGPPLNQTQAFQVPPGYPPGHNPDLIYATPGKHNYIIAMFLSLLCVSGFGQFYNRQYAKGTILLLATIVLSVLTAGIIALFTIPAFAIDAYLIGKKLDQGRPVRQWEFF